MKDTRGRKRKPLSATVRNAIFRKYDDRCAYCGRPAHAIDHVIPYSVVKRHDEANLVTTCVRCNSAAGDKIFRDFEEKKTWILGWRAGRDLGIEPLPHRPPRSSVDSKVASLNLRELMKRYRMQPTKKELTELGKRLAKIAERENPYSYKYLHSIYRANLKAVGLAICMAVEKALETHPKLSEHPIIEVYGRPDQAYAQVDGRIEICRNPKCGIKFLTDHPNRRFCKICHPPIRR